MGENDSVEAASASRPPKNLCSRLWHLGMAVLYFCLMVIALVSVLVFALFSKSFNERTSIKCFLFGTSRREGSDVVIGGSIGTLGASCSFNVWGETVVLIAAALFCVASVIKSIAGVKAANVLVIFEFLLLLLLGIVAFIVATLYSAGLSVTCAAFRKKYGDNDCSRYSVSNDKKTVTFYKNIHAAKITAWITVFILAIAGIISFILLCVFVFRVRRRYREAQPSSYGTLR